MRRLSTVVVATGLMMPAIAVSVMLTTIEMYRAARPDAPLFGGPAPESLVQSIIEGYGVEETYQFIRGGQDPNEPVRVDYEEYTGGPPLTVSPLMLAVAAGDSSAVRMLLSFGASLDRPENSRVGCLARELGNREIEAILREYREEGSEDPACTDRHADATTPLAAWAVVPPEAQVSSAR